MATKQLKATATNAQVLNYVRDNSSLEYQSRIGAAQEANGVVQLKSIMSYAPTANEFVNQLVNLIGLIQIETGSFTNPFEPFKGGMLEYGDTIEHVFNNLLTKIEYDPAVGTGTLDTNPGEIVFGQAPPPTNVAFNKINRQHMYKVTVNEDMIRRAMLSDTGLRQLVDDIISLPLESDKWDEYLIFKQIFIDGLTNTDYFKVTSVDPTAATGSDARLGAAKMLSEQIRAYTKKLAFRSTLYNPAGVMAVSNPSNLYLATTPEISACLDVNVLAFAFHTSAAEVPARVFEVDSLPAGKLGILFDKSYLVQKDTVSKMKSIESPILTWNYFWHHHGIYSDMPFANAIEFSV
jgi:hypothetical protein